jgi:hypothetical protein
MHPASDVFVMLKAGRLARVACHEKALPLIIDPCPDKSADNTPGSWRSEALSR